MTQCTRCGRWFKTSYYGDRKRKRCPVCAEKGRKVMQALNGNLRPLRNERKTLDKAHPSWTATTALIVVDYLSIKKLSLEETAMWMKRDPDDMKRFVRWLIKTGKYKAVYAELMEHRTGVSNVTKRQCEFLGCADRDVEGMKVPVQGVH